MHNLQTMRLLKKILGIKKASAPVNYADFWNWFATNEARVYKAVAANKLSDGKLLAEIQGKLNAVRPGHFLLAGMESETTAELVFTADGAVENIVFMEQIVSLAPSLERWTFTALKQRIGVNRLGIKMGDLNFDHDSIAFVPLPNPNYPDSIEIRLVYTKAYPEKLSSAVENGVFIYIDNLLGELDHAIIVDHWEIGPPAPGEELVSVAKLPDFLRWRQKEFVEKYEGTRRNTEEDEYNVMQAETKAGMPVFATINASLAYWDAKASHSWAMLFIIPFIAKADGLPDNVTAERLNLVEERLMEHLVDENGHLNLGRDVAEGERTIFFASKDFREAVLAAEAIKAEFVGEFDVRYEVFKDKYWRFMRPFYG